MVYTAKQALIDHFFQTQEERDAIGLVLTQIDDELRKGDRRLEWPFHLAWYEIAYILLCYREAGWIVTAHLAFRGGISFHFDWPELEREQE